MYKSLHFNNDILLLNANESIQFFNFVYNFHFQLFSHSHGDIFRSTLELLRDRSGREKNRELD